MKITSKWFVAASIVAAVVATVATASHSWGSYHWARTSSPFTLGVVDSVTPNWQVQMTTSLDKWDDSGVINFAITSANDSSRTRKQCRMVKGQIRICNASYGFNGWLGLASINIDINSHITQGTAKMKDSYSSYWTAEEMNHVMCQETGHLFGLGHTSEDGSTQNTCMDYSSSPTSQWPNQHDYDQLQLIYGHLDSYNSYAIVAGMTLDSKAQACVDGGQSCGDEKGAHIGHLMHKARGYEIYAYPEKDGTLTIHHVYLVDGHH